MSVSECGKKRGKDIICSLKSLYGFEYGFTLVVCYHSISNNMNFKLFVTNCIEDASEVRVLAAGWALEVTLEYRYTQSLWQFDAITFRSYYCNSPKLYRERNKNLKKPLLRKSGLLLLFNVVYSRTKCEIMPVVTT